MKPSKKGMTYFTVIIVIGVIITAIFLALLYRGVAGTGGLTSAMGGRVAAIRGDGCGSDTECNGNGVCVSARCACFIDYQCKISCDMSIGKCR